MIRVQGCAHREVAHLVNGDYKWLPADQHHDRWVYAKDMDADGIIVLIYFWNGANDYPAGWYFSPATGSGVLGELAFAYHSDAGLQPPARGWQVPLHGPAEPHMVVRWMDPAVPLDQGTCSLPPVARDHPGQRWDRCRRRQELETENGMDGSCPGVASFVDLAQRQAAGGRTSQPWRKVRRGGEAIDSSMAGWPERPPIQGEGRHAGNPPRGAGIIAFRQGHSVPGAMRLENYVCIVQKADGKSSFPKGGRKTTETLIDAAFREWHEECGIPGERLHLVPGLHVDEPTIGVRYLVAHCVPRADSSGPDPPTPGESTWKPPAEDKSDNDPIIKARWVSVERCLLSELSAVRRGLLRQALHGYSLQQ